MRTFIIAVSLLVFAAAGSAQSLKPQAPYALKEGINQGTSDSLVGTHYWYFYAMPGTSRVRVRMRTPMTLYGAQNSTLTITVRDANGGQLTKTVDGSINGRETTFTAPKVAKRIKIMVIVAPPSQNLLRMGGDYEVEVTGDVAFGEGAGNIDPIVRTFSSLGGSNTYGAIKFFANGTIETSNGHRGTWQSFDAENRIYKVAFNDGYRVTMQYIPGFGLVMPDSPNLVVFQELRR